MVSRVVWVWGVVTWVLGGQLPCLIGMASWVVGDGYLGC